MNITFDPVPTGEFYNTYRFVGELYAPAGFFEKTGDIASTSFTPYVESCKRTYYKVQAVASSKVNDFSHSVYLDVSLVVEP